MNDPVLTISVFTRHSSDCTKRDDPSWKRCKCRKSLYIYEGGKVTYKSAKTRSWEQAERVAAELRDAKDPLKIALAKLNKKIEAKDAPLDKALDQWIASMKLKTAENRSAYATFKRVLTKWARSNDFENLSDVTADSLDAWIGSWSSDATEKENRLKANTQKFRVAKIKAFFLWAYKLQKISIDPAAAIRTIRVTEDDMEPTQPLSEAQFEKVLKATYKDTEFGAELRAIFQLQRWLGIRLIDALMLARSGVKDGRVMLTAKKTLNSTGAKIDRPVPDSVIEALAAVSPRKSTHPDCYFWSRKCSHRALSTMWTVRIKKLNDFLDLKNEDPIAGEIGQRLQFRSHMLRDTFAVLLLVKGMKLQDVSRLLTHKSIRTTEQHYAKWSKERRDKLEQETMDVLREMGASFNGD